MSQDKCQCGAHLEMSEGWTPSHMDPCNSGLAPEAEPYCPVCELAKLRDQLEATQRSNNTLYELMVSGERRCAEKAEQELAQLREELETAIESGKNLAKWKQKYADECDQLREENEGLKAERDALVTEREEDVQIILFARRTKEERDQLKAELAECKRREDDGK